MLLSIFTSFILARRFKGKVYVLLMIVFLVIVSLVSIGVPSVEVYAHAHGTTTVWKVNIPAIPLSFPFHAHISEVKGIIIAPPLPFIPLPHYDVKLYTCGFEIGANYFIPLTTNYIIFLISFFLIINLVGAILGYWISKTTFIEKILPRRKTN